MARIKIQVPGDFHFTCSIPVRITDINYGGHVGNDTVLSLIHEARLQFLASIGYSEMNLAGVATIMSDVAIDFKHEGFYSDIFQASVKAGEVSLASFDLYYQLETTRNDKKLLIAIARTGMVCFDYQKKKVVAIPAEAKLKLAGS